MLDSIDWSRESNIECLRKAYDLLSSDPEKSEQLLHGLAQTGSVASMLYLGWAYQNGIIGGRVDCDNSERWYLSAVDHGSKLAAYFIANLYLSNGKSDKAIVILSNENLSCYSPALFVLGKIYYYGIGVDKNISLAKIFFEAAARLGHVFAKRKLSGLLLSGKYGFPGAIRGVLLLTSSIFGVIIVGMRDPSSDKLRC